jgi:outer membrane protein assembly factor BamB
MRGAALSAGALALVGALATAAAAEGEWSRFRGPNGSGISDAAAIPLRWTERDYNWKVTLPGGGYSSPVIWKDRVFLLCADDATANRTVLCLRAADGRPVWRKDYDSTPHNFAKGNSYASATPAVGHDGVYVTWTAPKELTLAGFTLDGQEKWRRDLGPYGSPYGSGTSPVLVGDLVVLANDQTRAGFLIAVDRRTGQTRWRVDRRMRLPSWATPCVLQRCGLTEIIFASSAYGITGLDADSGRMTWQAKDAVPDRIAASPIVADGLVVGACASGQGGVEVSAVRPPDAPAGGEAKAAYAYRTPEVPYVPTPLAKDGRLFLWGDHGTITCLRLASGEKVWVDRVEGEFYGSPVWVAGRLYCLSRDGEVFVIAAADRFDLLARNPLGEKSGSTPAVADGIMYLRTYTHLVSIGVRARGTQGEALSP